MVAARAKCSDGSNAGAVLTGADTTILALTRPDLLPCAKTPTDYVATWIECYEC